MLAIPVVLPEVPNLTFLQTDEKICDSSLRLGKKLPKIGDGLYLMGLIDSKLYFNKVQVVQLVEQHSVFYITGFIEPS